MRGLSKTVFVWLTVSVKGLSGNLNGCCYPNTSFSSASHLGGKEVCLSSLKGFGHQIRNCNIHKARYDLLSRVLSLWSCGKNPFTPQISAFSCRCCNYCPFLWFSIFFQLQQSRAECIAMFCFAASCTLWRLFCSQAKFFLITNHWCTRTSCTVEQHFAVRILLILHPRPATAMTWQL